MMTLIMITMSMTRVVITGRMGVSTSAQPRTGSVLRPRPGFFSLSLVRSYLDDLDDSIIILMMLMMILMIMIMLIMLIMSIMMMVTVS